jgi:hypothetical protein
MKLFKQYFPVSLLCQTIPLSTLSLNTLNLCSSFRVRDQVLHAYKTRGKFSFVYFNLYVFRQETRRAKTMNRVIASLHKMQVVLRSGCNNEERYSINLNLCNLFQ